MKYIVMESRNGDLFNKEFSTKEEALAYAEREFSRMSDHDKKHTDYFYVLESQNPNEEAENHFDGDEIKTYI